MSFLRRLANLGRSDRLSRDIDRELAFHLREFADELVAQGMSEPEALAAARRRFGNPTYLGERTRDVDVLGWLDSLLGDIRYGWRALRQRRDPCHGDPTALVPAVKGMMRDVHRLTSVEFRTLTSQLAASLRRERMLAWLSGVFGGLALALSLLGLYGVMAYTVARRRNEIGVRVALGANKARVLRMVLGDVLRVVAVGIVLGGAGAVASGKLVTSFLYGVKPAEPLLLTVSGLTLLALALGAGLIPALRAARVDPVSALRED